MQFWFSWYWHRHNWLLNVNSNCKRLKIRRTLRGSCSFLSLGFLSLDSGTLCIVLSLSFFMSSTGFVLDKFPTFERFTLLLRFTEMQSFLLRFTKCNESQNSHCI